MAEWCEPHPSRPPPPRMVVAELARRYEAGARVVEPSRPGTNTHIPTAHPGDVAVLLRPPSRQLSA